MRYFKVLILSIFIFALQVSPVFAQANITHLTDRQEVSFEIQSPYLGHELVSLSANLNITSQVTITPSGGYHLHSLLHMFGDGVGSISGDRYLVNQILISELSTNGYPSFTFTSPSKIMINRPGKGGDYLAHVLVHYTVNKDGSISAEVNESSFVCN